MPLYFCSARIAFFTDTGIADLDGGRQRRLRRDG